MPLSDLNQLAAMIGKAAATAATGFGIPEAIKTLKDAPVDILPSSAKFVFDAVQRIVDAIDGSHELLSHFTDKTNLSGGKWPQAVRN